MSGRIILFRGEVLVHNNSLTQTFFIEVPVPRQVSKISCICVRGIDCVSFLRSCLLDFGTVLMVLYLFFFFY